MLSYLTVNPTSKSESSLSNLQKAFTSYAHTYTHTLSHFDSPLPFEVHLRRNSFNNISLFPFPSFSFSLKLECEKLAQEKTEMQRHYVMVSWLLENTSYAQVHTSISAYIYYISNWKKWRKGKKKRKKAAAAAPSSSSSAPSQHMKRERLSFSRVCWELFSLGRRGERKRSLKHGLARISL